MSAEHDGSWGSVDDARGGLSYAERAEIAELRAALVREQARADQLKASIKAARRIGMAIGVLMGRHALGEHEAFLALEAERAHSGRKLHEAAEAVLVSGPLEQQQAGVQAEVAAFGSTAISRPSARTTMP